VRDRRCKTVTVERTAPTALERSLDDVPDILIWSQLSPLFDACDTPDAHLSHTSTVAPSLAGNTVEPHREVTATCGLYLTRDRAIKNRTPPLNFRKRETRPLALMKMDPVLLIKSDPPSENPFSFSSSNCLLQVVVSRTDGSEPRIER
jgi:hypothetical protein